MSRPEELRRGGGESSACGGYGISAMELVLEEVVRRAAAGEAVALCTVVSARGSTPQAAGARMLLLGDGKTIFPANGRARQLELVSVTQAKTGVLICAYRPAGPAAVA